MYDDEDEFNTPECHICEESGTWDDPLVEWLAPAEGNIFAHEMCGNDRGMIQA